MLSVPVAGGALAVADYGSREPSGSDQRIVLALHGITGNCRSWDRVARALDGSVRVLGVDLRGRGRSRDLPAPYGLAQHVADVLAVIDWLDRPQVHLAGHSLGAFTSARFATEYPDRVDKLTLLDGGLPIPGMEQIDPKVYLGAALARLDLTFASYEDYHAFWAQHPAFGGGQIDAGDVVTYADYDLIGEPPELRSGVIADAVANDAADLLASGGTAQPVTVPTLMLTAPRGLQNQPEPMQAEQTVRDWVAESPHLRQARRVPDVNHYSLVLGTGAEQVAAAFAR